MKKFILFIMIFVTMFSCLTYRAYVDYVKPADITVDQSIKDLVVIPLGRFKDTLYDSFINQYRSDPAITDRYSILDRENLDRILEEQSLSMADEFDQSTAVEIGSLAGGQGLVTIRLKNYHNSKRYGNVVVRERIVKEYKDKEGNIKQDISYKNHTVPSEIRTVSFTINTQLTDISTSRIVYSTQKDFYEEKEIFEFYGWKSGVHSVTSSTTSYAQRGGYFKEPAVFVQNTAANASYDLLVKVSPHNVEEAYDFEKLNDKNDIGSKFIRMIDTNNIDMAIEHILTSEEIIKTYKDKDQSKLYYNLGACYEIIGNYDKSLEYYQKAAMLFDSGLHLDAISALKVKIVEQDRLRDQIQ